MFSCLLSLGFLLPCFPLMYSLCFRLQPQQGTDPPLVPRVYIRLLRKALPAAASDHTLISVTTNYGRNWQYMQVQQQFEQYHNFEHFAVLQVCHALQCVQSLCLTGVTLGGLYGAKPC